MGSTLHGKNKKNGNFDLNIYGGTVLNYLAWGFKRKHGVYGPLSKEDCKVIARILYNKATWLEICSVDSNHWAQEAFNVYIIMNNKKDYLNSKTTLKFIRELAHWFDNCGGLVPDFGEIDAITCNDCEKWDGTKCSLSACCYKDFGPVKQR